MSSTNKNHKKTHGNPKEDIDAKKEAFMKETLGTEMPKLPYVSKKRSESLEEEGVPKKEEGQKSLYVSQLENEQLESNKKARQIQAEARRFVSLGELNLALENVDTALSIDTFDTEDFSKADLYFLGAQICRKLKDYPRALKYIERGIRTVNPYRSDSPKYLLTKGVIYLQLAEGETNSIRKKKMLAVAIDATKMAITVCEVLLNQRSEYRFEPKDIVSLKKYHMFSIFDLAYASDLIGDRRAAVESLDALFEHYPNFSISYTPFKLYEKIRDEKRILYIAK